jgi:hypothetical protein
MLKPHREINCYNVLYNSRRKGITRLRALPHGEHLFEERLHEGFVNLVEVDVCLDANVGAAAPNDGGRAHALDDFDDARRDRKIARYGDARIVEFTPALA